MAWFNFSICAVAVFVICSMGCVSVTHSTALSNQSQIRGLKSEQPVDKTGQQHGVWLSRYPNGRLQSRSVFKHGQLVAVEEWYPNGQKKLRQPFVEGLPHGLCVWWGSNGNILARSDFYHGTGAEHYFDETGRLRETRFWISGVRVPVSESESSRKGSGLDLRQSD